MTNIGAEVSEEEPDSCLDDLIELLSIPSVSCDPHRRGEVERCARTMARLMEQAGLETELVPTAGHPVVVGRWQRRPERPTVLIYGHYDVQPEDPVELWTTPPFTPSVRDGKIYARGATDDKGQVMVHVQAIQRLLRAEGQLPCNVIMVVEGEEEIGSLHFPDFLAEQQERLAADVFVVSDGAMWDGQPTLVYGLRGVCFVQVDLEGPEAGYHLCRMVASLKDGRGRIRLPGFYDAVRPLGADERALLATLPLDEEGLRAELGVRGLEGEVGFTHLERRMARPTLEVNGMEAGPGARAMAKITCRLVPDQDPPEMARLLQEALEREVPPGHTARFQRKGGGRPWLTPPDHPVLAAAARAVRAVHGRDPLYAREGGTIPVVVQLEAALGLPGILLGFGLHSENLHAPDEHFDLGNFRKGIQTATTLLRELGERG